LAWIGVDLGGTKLQGAVVDVRGGDVDVLRGGRRPTPPGEPAAVVQTITELVHELGGLDDVVAVGVGAPGAVDHRTGTVLQAPNLGWSDPVPLGEMLADALGATVVVDNDVNAGTVAEHHQGSGRGLRDLLVVFWGTGVGGGLVLDGRLRRGPAGYAGEIGHTVVRDGGRPCGCGHRGHVESYAGRAGLEREARLRHAQGEPTALVELAGSGRMRSRIFARALDMGDAVAIALLDEAVAALGAGIASAVTLLDLDAVVLGGGLGDRLGAAMVGRVEESVRSRLFASSSALRVRPASLGDLSGALGAAIVAHDALADRVHVPR
jgi:glucokinase